MNTDCYGFVTDDGVEIELTREQITDVIRGLLEDVLKEMERQMIRKIIDRELGSAQIEDVRTIRDVEVDYEKGRVRLIE